MSDVNAAFRFYPWVRRAAAAQLATTDGAAGGIGGGRTERHEEHQHLLDLYG
ncbi:MAG: hypothetical protein KBG48_06625 [Kofleriaceae bacterium]|jgi:hypothetical protein|nr:hypothetical protein [Kofleriaceae bacterium]MBP9167042.1 hypothetical protein [Kofleriaceae bacterium]MBP9860244.1 hypothetical protein [Kofleriaceae bacterium]